jgi:3-hydroxyacyl-[acyl-carrier-protein] dehydratase
MKLSRRSWLKINTDELKLFKGDIERILPQREPFLFVDEITDIVPGESVTGKKTFTGKEDFFKGHFPQMPLVPGVILLELAGQVSTFLILTAPKNRNLFGFFAGVDKFRFLKKVVPGQTLIVKSRLISFRHNVARSESKIYSNDSLVAQGVIAAVFVENESL